jgi:signal transduction histidine kinase
MILPLLFCLVVAASTAHPQGQGQWIGTPVEAKKLVQQAAVYLMNQGPEKALKEFSLPNGKFQWRDLYVFACDLKGIIRGHPNQALLGRNFFELTDRDGKYFGREIVELALSRGYGWVDYTYLDPLTQQEAFKITYFQKLGDLIICCGAYLP